MKRALWIGMVAALAWGCGRDDNAYNNAPNNTAQGGAAATAGASGATGTPGTAATSGSTDTIVLTGCLQRGSGNAAVGTSGKTRQSGGKAPTPDVPPQADNDRFILVNAKEGAPDASSAPAGTSGAAAKSGTTGTSGSSSSYVLEGDNPAGHEGQLVRITGHFADPLAGGVLSNRPAGSAQDSNAKPNASASPNAQQNPNRRDASNVNDVSRMRRVTVDSVMMVAANCSAAK